MKTEIHPEYVECRVTCSCGNQFLTRATVPELRVELCAECHPFYTGKQKLVDTGGRVERFTRRYAQVQEVAAAEAAPAKTKRKKRVDEAPKRKPPVVTKGGPRPKYERRPRGEEWGERRDDRGDRGRGGRGRGKKADAAPEAEAAPEGEASPDAE